MDFIELKYTLSKEFESKSEIRVSDFDKKVLIKFLNIKIDFPESLQDQEYFISIHFNINSDVKLSKNIFFTMYKCISEFTIRGVPGFEMVEIENRKRKIFQKDDFLEYDEYNVVTNGKNLSYISNIYGIDITRTILNDINHFYTLFGLEATRNILFFEIYEIFDSNGISINRSHIELLCDLMTCNGNITPINRFGLLKLNTQVLTKASFEKTIHEFTKASIYKESDDLISNSSRVIAGLNTFSGTGLCDVQVDFNKLSIGQKNISNSRNVKDFF